MKVDSKRITERNNRTSKEPPLKMTVNTESNKKSKLSTEPRASKNISKTTAKNNSRSSRLANKNTTTNKNTTKVLSRWKKKEARKVNSKKTNFLKLQRKRHSTMKMIRLELGKNGLSDNPFYST